MTIVYVITLRNKSRWVKYRTIIQMGIQVRIIDIYFFDLKIGSPKIS